MVAYFVVGVKYENVMMWDTYTSVGKFVASAGADFTAGMVNSYTGDGEAGTDDPCLFGRHYATLRALSPMSFRSTLCGFSSSCAMMIGFPGLSGLRTRFRNYFLISIFRWGILSSILPIMC